MVVAKDPQRSIVAPVLSEGKKPLSTSGAQTPRSKDDFSFSLDNMLRWWTLEQTEKHDADDTRRAEEIAEFNKILEERKFKTLSADDVLDKGTLSTGDLFRIDTSDKRAQEMRMGEVTDYQSGKRYYLVGKDLERYEARHAAESYLGNTNAPGRHTSGKLTEFRVSSAGQLQGELISSIDKAAKIAGVPSALLGAMTGIESGFDNPKMQVSPTGALGVMQQTGGYRTTMWKTYGDVVAQHVPAARAAMAGGLTKDEMKDLSMNNDSAILIAALRARDFAKKYNLDLNDKKTWGLVYLDHNSGEGSVKNLLSGKMTEKWIMDYNPAVYKGVNTPQEAIANFSSKMIGYANAYEKMEAKHESKMLAAANPEALAAINKASVASASAVNSGAPAKVSAITNGAKPELIPS